MEIIYIDDSEFDRLAFKRLIKKMGLSSVTIMESLDELDSLNISGDSILIRDCYVPGKEPDYSGFIEVYYVSGSKLSPSLQSKLKIDTDHFYLKPIKEDDLESMIKGTSVKENDSSLDLSYLDELSDGDEDFKREMVKVFLKEVPDQIDVLLDAVKNQDFKKIAETIHALRTKIRTFGILSIDELSENLEYTAKTKSFDSWTKFESEVGYLTSELKKSATELENMI